MSYIVVIQANEYAYKNTLIINFYVRQRSLVQKYIKFQISVNVTK